MTKTYAEIIDNLCDYLLKHSDSETTIRALANAMVDFYRLVNFDLLPKEQQASLTARIHITSLEVEKFAKYGDDRPFTLMDISDL